MPTWRFEGIGTGWEIVTDAELSSRLRAVVTETIGRFDREWSRFRDDSEVARLAAGLPAVPMPPDAPAMLGVYLELSAATGGAVNPLVGRSLEALGYDAAYSLTPGSPQSAPAHWQDLVRWSGEELSLSEPATIDVGAVGKGRLVDLVQAALAEVPGTVVVDAGGDIAVRGGPLRIALEHPYDASRAIGVVSLEDEALCASAVNRRSWADGLHHVLDARTGLPVRTWAATWAIASDAMTADAAATALFFDGGPELAARWGVHWVRMSTDGRAERSPACPATLFTHADPGTGTAS